MSPRKRKVKRKPFKVDGSGKFLDIFKDEDDVTFEYSLNLRRTGSYMATGTNRIVDPVTHETLKIYNPTTKKEELASIGIHIPYPKAGENVEEMIDSELKRTGLVLKTKFQEQFKDVRKTGKMLAEMTFAEAELVFLDDAKLSFSKNENTRNRYAASIRTFANELADVRIGKVNHKELLSAVSTMSDGGLKKLKDLKEFFEFIEKHQMISSGALSVVEKAIKAIPKKGNEKKHQHASKVASNSDVLSNEAERIFNQKIIAHKNEAKYVALALIKGAGLSLSEICRLKMKQVERDGQNREIIFLVVNRAYISATQDYTFPIFPLEALLLNDYIDGLEKTNGKSRLDGERYLFSPDDGSNPLAEGEVKQLCKLELQKIKFGYADLLGRVDLQKEKGLELLKSTYRSRLEKCGLTREKDEGAFLFMLHQSLGNKVQADHYRCLTGESGREFLLDIVMQDRRFIDEFKDAGIQRKTITYRTQGDLREYTLRKVDNQNIQQATIITELRAKDVVRFEAEHGCTVRVMKVTPLGTK